ncbi:hypothetical protein DYBT9623_04723 [Dyadobacter sp. CECT 9623]|uniref:Glycosyltransferase RgtA/B/C/D-like domain-containing protein n=1 Tax=Dyadobacter linearis TaxID=2823330 RepID=A0ABM8UWH7_9BACT|nr:glycosyltransferase family 39 protein [Dyadobacter sp. CECT 9623]CAG5073220.1 hypothetical protein DYBT9623_04723 [Dyadobacter sp. CECT 9623]
MGDTQLAVSRKSILNLKIAGWLLAICFICLTFVPRSFDHVLFVDGLAYAAISRNMAMGLGSFWEPYFADSFWLPYNRCTFFCEHPPLMFGMESLLFRLFGDSLVVENIYNLIVLIASVLLISLIWKELFKNNMAAQKQAWLPVLMWYGIRVVWWSVPNNLLDTTMAVFCLWSCYFQLKALQSPQKKLHYWVAAGLMIMLACLTKGPVGLFPLAFPAIYLFVYGKAFFTKAASGLVVTSVTFSILLGALLIYQPANYFLKNYFEGQVMAALLQKRERVTSGWTAHLYLLMLLLVNIVPHLLILGGLYLFKLFAKINIPAPSETRKVRILTILVGISIILPMLASVKQGDYYLMPALPFVGLFFGACCIEPLLLLADRFSILPKVLFPAVAVLLVGLMVYKLGHPDFDRNYEVAKALKAKVPERSKVYLPREVSMESGIHTAYQRYARLSIAFDTTDTDYLLFEKNGTNLLDSISKSPAYEILDLGNEATLAIRKARR